MQMRVTLVNTSATLHLPLEEGSQSPGLGLEKPRAKRPTQPGRTSSRRVQTPAKNTQSAGG